MCTVKWFEDSYLRPRSLSRSIFPVCGIVMADGWSWTSGRETPSRKFAYGLGASQRRFAIVRKLDMHSTTTLYVYSFCGTSPIQVARQTARVKEIYIYENTNVKKM